MPSLPSLFADHSLNYVNGHLLLCGGSNAARWKSLSSPSLSSSSTSFPLYANQPWSASGKSASRCQKTSSPGKSTQSFPPRGPIMPVSFSGDYCLCFIKCSFIRGKLHLMYWGETQIWCSWSIEDHYDRHHDHNHDHHHGHHDNHHTQGQVAPVGRGKLKQLWGLVWDLWMGLASTFPIGIDDNIE